MLIGDRLELGSTGKDRLRVFSHQQKRAGALDLITKAEGQWFL